MADRKKIRIRYKSGQEQWFTVDFFKVHYTMTTPVRVTQIDWEGIDPKPLFMGLDDIESVWEA